MKRVAIISHSVCFPREDSELSQIYPKLLQRETGCDLTLIGIGGGDIRLFTDQFKRIREFVDIVILDFGINDAIPRALKNYERYLISELGIKLPDQLNVYLRKFRKITHTKEKKFESLCTSILDCQKEYEGLLKNLSEPTLIVLPIAPIPQKIENTHPGATKNIKRFNEIFRRIFDDYFLETILRSELHLNSDGIHLNPEGHLEVYKKLSTILKK